MTTEKTKTVTAREGEEVWETTTDATIWLTTTFHRGNVQQEKATQFGGAKGSRVRIKTMDRLTAQEMSEDSAFDNGLLRRLDVPRTSSLTSPPAPDSDEPNAPEARAEDGGPQALTDEELTEIFGTNLNTFKARVNRMNELNVRRMKALITPNESGERAVDPRATEIAYLDAIIEEKYKAGGDTPTNAELRLSASAES